MADPEHATGPVVVVLPAEIDIVNAEGIGEQLRSALRPGVTVVIADMTSTVFCDSSGMRHLVLVHDYATAHDAQLRLAVPPGHVLRILKLMGLDHLLPIYPSLATALTDGSPV
ncbi:MAG TPA: STAS domain-containing protein [Streptosporangiaceae bacterium]|jgi:anti-sigma B factor antagonist|nr:STAS domain-containing protein [Streptosporangiaceae bacterium]